MSFISPQIRGTAIQSTGSKMPLYVPNGSTQKEVIRMAYLRAGRDPTDVDFAELHMTGTSVGDPIEANAVAEIFAREDPLCVGSVKGNLGHLEAAAFLASLLKACLILEKRMIPPTAHRGLYRPYQSVVTFVVGGLSPTAVDQISNSIRKANLSDVDTMRACAVTLSRRARQLPDARPQHPPPVSFIFSGQGPQNLEMGRGLFAVFPVFRSTILELDGVYRRVVGESLLETTGLFISSASSPSIVLSPDGWPVTITVSAIAMLQIALFDLLVSVGITPSSLAGHSAGETAVLYASGAGSKEMALEIAIARGQSMTITESPNLGMASLACSADVARAIISRMSGAVEISCYNSPNSVTISGTSTLLAEAVDLARADGIFAQRIRTMVPGHSSYMDPIRDECMARMEDIFARYTGPRVPRIPVFSTCTGETLVNAFTPAYFWSNCRHAVLFSSAISSVLEFHTDAAPIFLEISCHPVLATLIASHGVTDKSVLCPMRRASAEDAEFSETLARITLLGYNSCDLSGLYGVSDFKPSFLDHPMVHRPIPPPKTYSDVTRSTERGGLLSGAVVNDITHPVLAQHIINGQPILPATGFLEMALGTGANLLWDVEFVSIFSLSAQNTARLMLERSGCSWSLTSVDSSSSLQSAREHARGFMDVFTVETPKSIDLKSLWSSLPELSMKGEYALYFYPSLRPFVDFGPAFRKVLRCRGKPSEAIAEIQAPSVEDGLARDLLHPAALDACIHIILHPDVLKKDSKSYDITVADTSGTVICELTNLVLQRLSAPLPPILRRYDLDFQPVSVLPDEVMTEATYSQREPSDEAALFTILDSLAARMISKSLQNNPAVGDDVSRRRYLDFAKRAASTEATLETLHEEHLRTKYPAHFEVTDRIASVHETVFTSSKEAVGKLYSDDLMTRFYNQHSGISTVYPEVVKSFSSLLDSLQKNGKRVVNILEVGAGTGLLTRYLAEVLRKSDLLTEYTVTDASYGLASELARTIEGPKMTPKLYDLTKDPVDQGLVAESHDVIVALHVLHAVPDLRTCLSNLRKLLVPGGTLFVIEMDGTSWPGKVGSVWYDCVFGSFSEWFGFADGRAHCTMSPAGWMEMLKGLGFINSHANIEPGMGGHNFLFTSQKPVASVSTQGAIDPHHIIPYALGNEVDLQHRIKELDPGTPLDVYIATVEGRDGDSAMGLCAALRREFPGWSIRLAIFSSAIKPSVRIIYLSKHRNVFDNGEPVVLFSNDGSPCVSRIVLTPPPTFAPADYPPTPEDPDYVMVEIVSSEKTALHVHGFIGRVLTSPLMSPGNLVLGITDQPMAPILVVNLGCIAHLDAQSFPDPHRIIELIAPSLTLDALPKSLSRKRPAVFIAMKDGRLSDSFIKHFSSVSTVDLFHCDLEKATTLESVDVVITDSLTSAQYPALRHLVSASGRFIVWNALVREHIREGSERLAGALDLVSCAQSPSLHLTLEQPLASALFHADKCYIVLGGIGGLGVDLAVWMYQHGARQIVLTSRRGIASLDHETDEETLVKVAYLRGRADLTLRLEACDATDVQATSRLLQSIGMPMGGCFQMSLVLSDALFVNQTEEKFSAVRDSKLKVFETFAAAVDVGQLEFYVAFSSISGLVGIAGQSNYASACTALEGALSRHQNAFCVVLPEVRDVGYLHRADSRHIDKSKNGVFAISMSPAHLWCCVQDGLQTIKEGSVPCTRYIPDLDWSALHAQYPLPRAFHHILRTAEHSPKIGADNASPIFTEEDVFEVVLSFVEVEKEVFDSKRPLLSYGLDSLSAARLSAALEPFLQVSQVQLLSGVSWEELRRRIVPTESSSTQPFAEQEVLQVVLSFVEVEKEAFDYKRPLLSYGLDSLTAARLSAALQPFLQVSQMQLLAGVSWDELRRKIVSADSVGEEPNIVELCAGPGIPLFVFPGIDGGLGPILPLRTHFSGTLWGVQVTHFTPTSPFSAQAAFFVEKIREKQPQGPYRLGAYSASGVIVVAIAKLLEASGEEVSQVVFIDHFPLLWTHEAMWAHVYEDLATAADSAIGQVADMSRVDSVYGPGNEFKMEGHENVEILRRLTQALLSFLGEFQPRNDPEAARDSFIEWVSSVKAPFSLVAAEAGIVTTLPEASREAWAELGLRRCRKPVKCLHVPGIGHYGICSDERTAKFLQEY
ncbi:acyl transferase domain-containing protein [Roridomyces roridus]|uniref:Acyl transferase domain-containing protein n=1 Tax=Roridomyces roridus TaxID=1738132 RepID=A0AAD7BJ85_9AGAR|nr:acyl transferase domain-containing protein [Roridomyces roridus]